MDKHMEAIVNALTSAMYKNNWSITRLSIECGVSCNTLSPILYGRNKSIKLDTLVRISQGLNIPISQLINEEEQIEESNKEFLLETYRALRQQLRKVGVAV